VTEMTIRIHSSIQHAIVGSSEDSIDQDHLVSSRTVPAAGFPNCGIRFGFLESIPSYPRPQPDLLQPGGKLRMTIRSSAELVSTHPTNAEPDVFVLHLQG